MKKTTKSTKTPKLAKQTNPKNKITLRPYQTEAVEACLSDLIKKHQALLVMGTGLGKTITSMHIVQALLDYLSKGETGRVLFLVHNNYILVQAMKAFKAFFGNTVSMASYNGQSSKKKAHQARFVFATWQTMGKNLYRWDKKYFDVVTVDESHWSQADTYRPTLEHFVAYKLGMTATPDRADRRNIKDLFGEESYLLDGETALKRGLFPHVDYHFVGGTFDDALKGKIEAEKDRVRSQHDPDEIKHEVLVREQEQEFVNKILEHTCTHGLVFCRNIAHANLIAELMPSCKALHSGSTDGTKSMSRIRKRNEETLEAFKSGQLRYIAAVDALNEGVDIPAVDLVVLLRAHGFKNAWIQQVGRGLRLATKGKKKLTVLDFAHNRQKLDSLFQTFGAALSSSQKIQHKKTLVIKFEGITYTFEKEALELIEFYASLKKNFYGTCAEASEAAIAMGIENLRDYRSRHREDSRLPSAPHVYYTDFPGYTVFLGGSAKNFYETCAEASKAAIAKGIEGKIDYIKRYTEDPRLPSAPDRYYSDFPCWRVFLGGSAKSFYGTWQEASKAVIASGIRNCKEYTSRCKEDPRLPSTPHTYYSDFPGYTVFFGGSKKDFYGTWQEASKAVVAKGIESMREYKNRCKEDPRLPSTPDVYYSDWPGYTVFFGGLTKSFYGTCEEASKAAIAKGIEGKIDYIKRYTEDPRLPSNPHLVYPLDWPGWPIFLGGTKKDYYATWRKASKAVIALGIRTVEEYKKRYKEDPRLPSAPAVYYANFPGWPKFLGKKK